LERFPDALRQELHILTYREWQGDHEPFDYERHLLQVVAVEHIVQAAEIAFIYDEEIESLQPPFVAYADRVAEQLGQI